MKKTSITILTLVVIVLLFNCGSKKENHKSQLIETNLVNCDSCWASNFVQIAQDITNVSETDLSRFFLCCCKKCSNNVEFSEFSGGVIYRLLIEHTEFTLEILSNTKNLEMNYIDFIIQNPVDDGIDVDSAINKVNSSIGDHDLKNRILKSLEIAKEKM
ncbi:MAG: hypothetical protein IPJ16_02205 [Bacteroidales bacterium]|nr:hypothetical protein [Bacteroidales bacterium]